MFEPGTRVVGYTYTDEGRVRVEGVVVSRTDDPEELWQDYVVQDDAGTIHHCDEQEVRPSV